MTDVFYNPAHKEQLHSQQLNGFEDFWNKKLEWFEPVNERREGWSGVSRFEQSSPKYDAVFIKRQQNHNTRTLLHPLKGVPATFRREFGNIQVFHNLGIPTLTPVYYGERKCNGDMQAILVTQALDQHQDLFSFSRTASIETLNAVMEKLAEVVRKMHDLGLAHYCLYPNHVFVLEQDGEIDIRLIDLEKARKDPLSNRRRFKDLECFFTSWR